MTLRYRLLFLDLDGTVLDESGKSSQRVLDALQAARRAGCEVVICTGRARSSARRGAAGLGPLGYAIVLNGAEVLRWDSGEVLHRAAIPVPESLVAVRLARSAGLAPVCFGLRTDERDLVTDRHAPLFPYYAEVNATRITYVDDLMTDVAAEPLSIAVYGTREQTLPTAEAWRQELEGRAAVFHGPTHYYGCWYAQLNAEDADKAVAARFLAHRLGVPREQTIAIGDHVNDLKLLQWAGMGVCMGDGDEAARACAAYVTGALADDGAAAAIEEFILGKPALRP